ncbi:MAG: rod shape-determining protein, partial [Oscillospiraceae bacterium]
MKTIDIGIDLGTATVIIYDSVKGIVLREPSVVAINTYTGAVLGVGEEAYKMLGRTPDKIRAVKPLADGVISDFDITEKMLKYFIKKVCHKSIFFKPRVALCVP